MLPSKGYFRSIDCPFYKNNLCHRFYCHFRHNKKKNCPSMDIDLMFVSNEDDSPMCEDVLDQVALEAKPELNKIDYDVCNVENNSSSRNKTDCTFMPPNSIPCYNPTPIAQLKTRCGSCEMTVDCKTGNCTNNHVNKDEVIKDNHIEKIDGNLVKINDKCDENKITNNESTTKVNKPEVTGADKLSITETRCTVPENEDILAISNINSIIQENIKLKEAITKLKSVEKSSDIQKSKTILDNKTLLEDLMGCNDSKLNVASCSNVKEPINDVSGSEGFDYKKQPSKPNKNNSINRDHIKWYNKEKSKFGSDKSTIITKSPANWSHKICKQQAEKRFAQIENSTAGNSDENSNDNLFAEPAVIVLSDSEEQDKDSTDTSFATFNCDSNDDLSEPKKKVRISHMKKTSTNQPVNDLIQQQDTDKTCNETDYDYPQPKQKIRIAHTLNYNTLSIKSVKDHLAHWQRVKERVQKKCVNPSGQEGYQNWSKVKISPVPNAMSLINSKKLLYSNINKWKSKTNI